MTLPLSKYRVLDLTTWFQSVAARMLGDLGAEIIKIEPRGGGDPARGAMAMTRLETGKEGRNMSFEHPNFNKKSITLDLRKEAGRAILYKLVEKSDVFIHNLRSDAAIRLGIDYPTLSKHNPHLIYTLSCAWGSRGEGADRAAYDRMVVARSGLMTYSGEPGTPPGYINASLADHMGATMVALATVSALLGREETGVGQEVECSLLGSMMHLMGHNVDNKLATGREIGRTARSQALNPLWNEYICKDGKGISLGMLMADRYWHSFCRALGIEEIETDPRFETMALRGKNAAELIQLLDKVFASRPRSEWMDILNLRGDLIFEPINSIADLAEDPQIWANDYVDTYHNPRWGETDMLTTPIRFGSEGTKVNLPPPELGEHTEMILCEILGLSLEDITGLKEEEVI